MHVTELTHSSKRLGHGVPGVVVWRCLIGWCFIQGCDFPPRTELPKKNGYEYEAIYKTTSGHVTHNA